MNEKTTTQPGPAHLSYDGKVLKTGDLVYQIGSDKDGLQVVVQLRVLGTNAAAMIKVLHTGDGPITKRDSIIRANQVCLDKNFLIQENLRKLNELEAKIPMMRVRLLELQNNADSTYFFKTDIVGEDATAI